MMQPVERIQHIVADAYGLKHSELTSHCQCRSIAWPRQVAMFLAREKTDYSLIRIARLFNRTDHSTVIHAVRSVEHRMEEMPRYRAKVEELREALQ